MVPTIWQLWQMMRHLQQVSPVPILMMGMTRKRFVAIANSAISRYIAPNLRRYKIAKAKTPFRVFCITIVTEIRNISLIKLAVPVVLVAHSMIIYNANFIKQMYYIYKLAKL